MQHTRIGLESAGLAKFAREAHWFDMTALFDVPAEVRDFGKEMAVRGLIQIPYQKVIYWFARGALEGLPEQALLCEQVAGSDGKRIEVRIIMEKDGGSSVLTQPFMVVADAIAPDGSIGGTAIHVDYIEAWSAVSLDAFRAITRPAVRWIAQIGAALLSPDVESIRIGPSERTIARAAELGREPALVYHMLALKPHLKDEIRIAYENGTASRKKTKLHWRRGHFRDISHGTRERLVPISPCIVGSKHAGMVVKDYTLKGAK